ncbi:MAG: NAD-dependent epimerase/dehydratase family protein, partial [bacterium]|nr:NAD-dependent epimerase/dehydratase family protein [bacterium]
MKVLITGASGFTAKYLADLLAAEPECEIYLTDRISGGFENILSCDLTQKGPIEELICKIRPERIYHLAGSFSNNYDLDYSVNVLGTKNVLDA